MIFICDKIRRFGGKCGVIGGVAVE